MADGSGPLGGIRVVEAATLAAGPMAGAAQSGERLLADDLAEELAGLLPRRGLDVHPLEEVTVGREPLDAALCRRAG